MDYEQYGKKEYIVPSFVLFIASSHRSLSDPLPCPYPAPAHSSLRALSLTQGEVLGYEQSGDKGSGVGYDVYMNMLAEALVKGKALSLSLLPSTPRLWSLGISMPLYLPLISSPSLGNCPLNNLPGIVTYLLSSLHP